jgi:hypothetical protein
MILYIILSLLIIIIIFNIIIVSTNRNLTRFQDWFFGRSKIPEYFIIELEGNDKIFVYKVYEKGPNRGLIELIETKEKKNDNNKDNINTNI